MKTLTEGQETDSRLTEGQESPELAELERLRLRWLDLRSQAQQLQVQREEDLQRAAEYHLCISAVETLFEQVSRDWDNLAR